MTITLTREQLINRQKSFGVYVAALLPPVKYPSPLAGNRSIAQAYWLNNVLEELDEFHAGAGPAYDELADVLIFLQALHFTITDEPFVMPLSYLPKGLLSKTGRLNCRQTLRELAPMRKTWKSYPQNATSCADWFRGFMFELKQEYDISFELVAQAYEAKIHFNKVRADWDRQSTPSST
jgi:hypothetical protein